MAEIARPRHLPVVTTVTTIILLAKSLGKIYVVKGGLSGLDNRVSSGGAQRLLLVFATGDGFGVRPGWEAMRSADVSCGAPQHMAFEKMTEDAPHTQNSDPSESNTDNIVTWPLCTKP